MSKKANAVDFLKLIFAIGVMGIHTKVLNMFPLEISYYITQCFFRLAVPFFFVSAGYFWGKEIIRANDLIGRLQCSRKFVLRNFIPFLLCGILGEVWNVVMMINEKEDFVVIELLGKFLFYPPGGMWFVLACMVATLIISLLWNYKKILVAIACVSYGFALIANSYFFIVEDMFGAIFIKWYLAHFVSARNGLFVGLPLFGIGVLWYLIKRRINMKRIGALGVIIFYILEVILTFDKSYVDDRSIYMSTPVLAVMILEYGLNYQMPYNEEVSFRLRRYSKYIFYLHPIFNVWIGYILFSITQNGIIQFIYVAFCCFASIKVLDRYNLCFLMKNFDKRGKNEKYKK